MALGGAPDRFDAVINHFHGALQVPRGNNQKWLQGKIELRSKAATDGSGNDANRGFRNAKNCGDVFAVCVWRLRAGLHFDAITDAARETCLRLDVRVLDES